MADINEIGCNIAVAPSALPCSATDGEVFSLKPDSQPFGTGSDFIAPFHSSRPASQKASRTMPQSRTVSTGSKNNYNRVRRRSPLCHDVLEFMLEGASMSSQESLPLNIATASISRMTGADKAVRNKQSHYSSNLSQDPVAAIYPDHNRSVITKTAESGSAADASTDIAGISYSLPHVINGREKTTFENTRRLEDSDSDDGSDAETGYDSGDGFDGKCGRSTGMISPASTAECSRSNSYKSSKSSEASDDSTATEPSLKWWKRGFRSSKSKKTATVQIMPSISEPSRRMHTADETMHQNSPTSHRVPILAKIRRSVSLRGSPRTATTIATADHSTKTKRNSTVVRASPPRLPTKLTRAASVVATTSPAVSMRNSLSSGPSDSTPVLPQSRFQNTDLKIDSNKSAANRPVTVAITDNLGSAEVQWTMLKCKGMMNLHIVSVPPAIGSLNHKDAFLFYPCLFRRINDGALSTLLMQTPSPSDDVFSSGETSPVALRHSQMPHGPLLNQEYTRRKSICSLASRVIYVWIGAHASAIKCDAVTRVAMEIRDKELMGKAVVVVIDESTDSDSSRRKFFAQLHAAEHGITTPLPNNISTLSSQITPLCRAGDDLDFEKALERRKVLYGFWESVPPATIISVGTDINAAMLLKVPAGGVVVLDTWSDVFIWWRNEPGNSAVRKCAINFANMLVQDVCIPTRPKSASVWHELRGFEHVIFKTKFSDWPFVFTSSMSSSARISRLSVPPESDTDMSTVGALLRPVSQQNRVVAVA